VRRGQKAAGLHREDGRAAEGQTFGEIGFFYVNVAALGVQDEKQAHVSQSIRGGVPSFPQGGCDADRIDVTEIK
jgi:hypothetical protein